MSRGIYTVSIGLLFVASQVLGCTKFEPGARASETGHEFDTDDRKVFYSKVVVYGEVMERVKGNYPYKGVKGVFTVKFNVRCTYLGGPDIPSTIYIAGLGNANNQIKGCPAAEYKKGKTAVMFLKNTTQSDVFEVEYSPNYGLDDVMLDDLSMVCDLNLEDNHDQFCGDFPQASEEDGCVRWKPIKITPPEEKTPKPEPEEEPPVAESEEETSEPEPEEETENKDDEDDNVVINGKGKGKNNQSDEGYETKPETDKNTGPAAGSTGDENGSPFVTASMLVTLITIFLTIVV